jgi:hypothetical protein
MMGLPADGKLGFQAGGKQDEGKKQAILLHGVPR